MLGIKEDSRTILERLRRTDLCKILKSYNIPFKENSPASFLRGLIQNAQIDPMAKQSGIEYVAVEVQNEDGSYHKEIYPAVKPHASEGKDIDYDEHLRIAHEAAQAEKIKELEATIKSMGDAKEAERIPPPKVPSDMRMGELKAYAKGLGIKTKPTMRKTEVLKLVEDATQRS